MKRKIIFMIALLIITLSSCVVYAKNNDVDMAISQEMEGFLKEQMSKKDEQKLANRDYYVEQEVYDMVKDSSVIKVYDDAYWEYSDCSLESKIKVAEQEEIKDYFVMSEEPFRIREWDKNGDISISMQDEGKDIPTYIQDIILADINMYIENKQCVLNDIVCFDGNASHDGVLVYYLTNIGTYVKYYEHRKAKAMVFEEEEFQTYAIEYYEYSTSIENNYSEDGSPLYGGKLSFATFIENKDEDSNNKSNGATNILSSKNVFWFICGGILLLVVISEVAASAKRRKNKQNQ